MTEQTDVDVLEGEEGQEICIWECLTTLIW